MKRVVLGFTLIYLVACNTALSHPSKKQKPSNAEINRAPKAACYDSDGHYWTVLLVTTLLNIKDARTIAYHAEYPDNVINAYGHHVKGRYTFLIPGPQQKIHALTGKDHHQEIEQSLNLFKSARTTRDIGIAAHRLGDSYSHYNDKKRRMYPKVIGHLFQWTKPDKVRSNGQKYLEYVYKLVEALGGPEAKIDMTAFIYIAKSGYDSEVNSAILKTEYHLISHAPAFNIPKNHLLIVEDYLNKRLENASRYYFTHTDIDRKGRPTHTIILTRNEQAPIYKVLAEGTTFK